MISRLQYFYKWIRSVFVLCFKEHGWLRKYRGRLTKKSTEIALPDRVTLLCAPYMLLEHISRHQIYIRQEQYCHLRCWTENITNMFLLKFKHSDICASFQTLFLTSFAMVLNFIGRRLSNKERNRIRAQYMYNNMQFLSHCEVQFYRNQHPVSFLGLYRCTRC